MPISALTKIYVAKQTTFGTAATTGFTLLPVNSCKPRSEYGNILDKGIRGIAAADFNSQAGVGKGVVEAEGDFYPDILGLLLYQMLGTLTSAGTASPYTHSFSLLNSAPPIITLQEVDQVQTQNFPSMNMKDLTLSFNRAEGALTWKASWEGEPGATATSETGADATGAPMIGWQAAVTLGTSAYAKLMSCELTLAREVSLVYGANSSQSPNAGYARELSVTAKATVEYTAFADLQKYLNKTQQAFVVNFNNSGTGTADRQLTFTATTMDYADSPYEIDRGEGFLTLAYNLRGIYNTTDVGPCKIALINATATY